jgi:hypothetical protein
VLPSATVPAKIKTTCCRSSPRCAGCPVVLAARARVVEQRAGTRAALVEEMLVGRAPRPLPAPVQSALQQLVAARAPGR